VRSRATASWSTSSTSSLPVLAERGEEFVVERPGRVRRRPVYESYADLEDDFVSEELHPADLKPSAGEYISEVIDPVRERLDSQPDLLAEAYPGEVRRRVNGDG